MGERMRKVWQALLRFFRRAIAVVDTTRRVGTSLLLLLGIGAGLWLVLVPPPGGMDG